MSWGIHNSLKGWTLFGLNNREMQLLVKTMSVNEIKLTQVCHEGDVKWTLLNESSHPELFQFAQGEALCFPVIENKPKDVGDTEYFVVRPKKQIQPRLHQRYEIEVTCQIFSTTRKFTTSTIDLSEGGIYFKETIPDWVSGYFLVGVQATDTVYQLMCSLVEDQKDKKRVQIVAEETEPHYVAYKEWLLTLEVFV